MQEVDREDPGGLGAEKLPPGRARTARRRIDARAMQYLPDGGRRDRMFGIIGRRGTTVALLRRFGGTGAARLAPRLLGTRVGARLGGYIGQYRIRYRYPGTGSRPPAWADDQVVGLRLPPAGGNHQALQRLTWQLHTYGTQAGRPDLPDWIEDPQDFGHDKHQRLRPDRLYLVRPDSFIAASLPLHAKSADRAQLRAALAAHDIKN